MLRKLLKYDLQNIFKFIIIFYTLAMFFALLTRIFSNFENSLILYIIAQIFTGATISMMCSSLINNIMRFWVRFKSNFYGDESYLTHTLPIKKRTLYLSKIISSLITLFTTFAAIGCAFFMAYYSKDFLQSVKNFLLPLANAYDISITLLLVVLLFIFFLEFANIMQCGFTGIILGHRMNNTKIGFSVLFGFISFFISQIIVLLCVFVIALFNDNLMNLFVTEKMVDVATIKLLVIISIAAYSAILIIGAIINTLLFKKGVNVD